MKKACELGERFIMFTSRPAWVPPQVMCWTLLRDWTKTSITQQEQIPLLHLKSPPHLVVAGESGRPSVLVDVLTFLTSDMFLAPKSSVKNLGQLSCWSSPLCSCHRPPLPSPRLASRPTPASSNLFRSTPIRVLLR